jgi:hypothetical protein
MEKPLSRPPLRDSGQSLESGYRRQPTWWERLRFVLMAIDPDQLAARLGLAALDLWEPAGEDLRAPVE